MAKFVKYFLLHNVSQKIIYVALLNRNGKAKIFQRLSYHYLSKTFVLKLLNIQNEVTYSY